LFFQGGGLLGGSIIATEIFGPRGRAFFRLLGPAKM
jgi:hypothetical protein